ncbi:hypothetical protein [Pseudomonas hunanensis]|uniref:hypothetical protein n=1 Tax=Pseudomonas hunanensis TaxID=1247546 RepID=UPI0030DC9A86
MPYYDHRWHLFTDEERRRYGESKRKELSDRLSRAWHAKWLSKSGLKQRLWTDKAITQFLDEPRDAGPIKAWSRENVLQVESSAEFKAWMVQRRTWLAARGKLTPAPAGEPELETLPVEEG